MCGITGYLGYRSAIQISIANLKRLEYRGYDSAGLAYMYNGKLQVLKAEGRIANLEQLTQQPPQEVGMAIAHTRWATHGPPCTANSHPHADCSGDIAVVHNGIIENYALLQTRLTEAGHTFQSETDTETIAHLIEEAMSLMPDADFAEQVRTALKHIEGSYAIAVLCKKYPDTIFVARQDSPLIIGHGEQETLIASDIPAVMQYTRRVTVLQDGDCAIITPQSVVITNHAGEIQNRTAMYVDWDDQSAEKGGFEHFMLKEIHEGPRTMRDTLRGRMSEAGTISLPDLPLTNAQWASYRNVTIIGCGTAYHAGFAARRMLEQLLQRQVDVQVASEFRYSSPILNQESLVILISQSGETADTLAAMRLAKQKGAATLGVVNVVGSSLAREADMRLITQAGPEIGVASTKAYLAQVAALQLLGLHMAASAHAPTAMLQQQMSSALPMLPALLERCLTLEPQVKELAAHLAHCSCFFFLGRGYDYATALEAALKLKEISYIHAEAYPAGEMKHGPLALVEPGVATVGLCTQKNLRDKMISNLKEVKARGGTVLVLQRETDVQPDCADYLLTLPDAPDFLMPIIAMLPLQLLAYHVALQRGCAIDQPRNLAKSVTVE